MKDWQKRVINEKIELDKKIPKITTFLFLNEKESKNVKGYDLLFAQRLCMIAYSDILTARIKGFENA